MAETTEVHEPPTQGKTAGDLGREALWFFGHSLLAVITLLAVILLMTVLMHPDPDADSPKLIATALGFVAPLVVGFIMSKSCGNDYGKYVWISGLLFFSFICVWVIDLPTGPGQCEHCSSLVERLSRTFFDIHNGSGLMGGNGLAIGTWIPLSMFGYAAGSRFALGGSKE